MAKAATFNRSIAQENALLVGGCHGTFLIRDSDDGDGASGRRQLALANAIVLAACLAIVAVLGAIVWGWAPERKGSMAMFELERFIDDCDSAVLSGGQEAVREVLARAIADPGGVVAVLGEPRRSELKILHRSPRLTILNLLWPPHHTQVPHNHLIWAEVGVYCGREDNIFWRRRPPDDGRQIEAVGATSISTGRRHSLERDAIHSVNNPLDRVTAALHLYGGDLSIQPRTMWDGESLIESPIEHARDHRAMDAYNASLAKGNVRSET